MIRKIANSILIMGLALVLLTLGGCKDDSVPDEPEAFDPAIDGIAVQSLPSIDIEMARRIKREGPVSPIADATDESIFEAITAPPPAGTTTPGGLPTGSGLPPGNTGGLPPLGNFAPGDPNGF